jgi:hypothetical protein
MDSAPFTHRTPNQTATGEESLVGRDALVALVRLLARQAARHALATIKHEQENRTHEED